MTVEHGPDEQVSRFEQMASRAREASDGSSSTGEDNPTNVGINPGSRAHGVLTKDGLRRIFIGDKHPLIDSAGSEKGDQTEQEDGRTSNS